MSNPFLGFLTKLQTDLEPIEAATLTDAEQIAFAELNALVEGLVNRLTPAANTTATA